MNKIAFRSDSGADCYISKRFAKAILGKIDSFTDLTQKDISSLKDSATNGWGGTIPSNIPRHHPELVAIVESGIDSDWDVVEITTDRYYIAQDSSGQEEVIDSCDLTSCTTPTFEILKRINEELSVHIGEQRDDYEHDGAYGLQVAPWRAKEEGLPIKKIFLCDGKEWLWNIEFTKKEFKELIDELLAVHDMMED